jgi:hypothetical protein
MTARASLCDAHAAMRGRHDRHHAVVDAVTPGHAPMHLALLHRPHETRQMLSHPREAFGPPAGLGFTVTSTEKRSTGVHAPLASTSARLASSAGTINAALAGNGAHQMVELLLDGIQVIENIGVVEFQIVEDGGARRVMDELGALVEEGGVVFVGFDHKDTCRRPVGRWPQSPSARRRSGSPAPVRPAPGSRPPWWWWWSCHACPPRR